VIGFLVKVLLQD